MTFFVGFLCVFNVVMWVIFLVKFKKLFTTEDTIQNAKVQMNNILKDLNKQTSDNLSLLEDKYQKLRLLISEADRKLKMLNDAEIKTAALGQLKTQVNETVKKTAPINRRGIDLYASNMQFQKSENSISKMNFNPADELPSENDKISLTESGEDYIQAEQQHLLFEVINPDEVEEKIIDTNTPLNVSYEGGSYAGIPVVKPSSFVPEQPYDENSLESEKNLKDKICDLYDCGLEIEKIANNLGISLEEVQWALTFGNRI